MGAYCRWSLYLIIDIREGLRQRSSGGNDVEDERGYRRESKNPIFYICWVSLWNGRLLESEPNFLQFNDYTPMKLAEITNTILLIYEMRYPHGVLDMFLDCFTSLPEKIRAKWNGGLCRLLLDYIQNKQVKWLDFYCSIQDINHFTKQDIELGIPFSLCDKSSRDPKFSD